MSEEKITSEEKQWLDVVIPRIAESMGSCEEGTRYVLHKIIFRAMSKLYFVHTWYTNKINQLKETRSLVIKTTKGSVILDVRSQFHNEIVFYQMYQADENFPKCFYVFDSLPNFSDYPIIVLEDVSTNGFEICPVNFDASYSYVLAAIRELGRFHAKGYVLKEKNRAKFYSIVDNIEETRFNETKGKEFGQFLNITSTRAVEYLRKHGHDTNFCDKMEALLSNAFENVMMRISTVTKSSESLATICHGDATLSNMLFQPQNNGHFNAMLIDFGHIRYSTPVIDLSTFFCLNCTNHMMRDKLYDLLAIYHKALINYMSLEGVTDAEKYSYHAIVTDYEKGCLFGFIIASFYLVVVLEYRPSDVPIMNISAKEIAQIFNESGGENVSAMLAEMLLLIVDRGCLKHFS